MITRQQIENLKVGNEISIRRDFLLNPIDEALGGGGVKRDSSFGQFCKITKVFEIRTDAFGMKYAYVNAPCFIGPIIVKEGLDEVRLKAEVAS
jgi:hypothetical protein